MHIEPSTVRKVSVISTGSGSIHPEHMYGTRKPAYWWILTSKQWVPIPVNVFVLEHDDGIVLFDTGLDPRVISDPEYWRNRITRGFMSRIYRFEMGPDETLANQLQSAGYEPSDVIKAVLSHLHFDHVGGILDIPHAKLLVIPSAKRCRVATFSALASRGAATSSRQHQIPGLHRSLRRST